MISRNATKIFASLLRGRVDGFRNLTRAYVASDTGRYQFETLSVSSPYEHVFHVELNRPDVRNAINKDMLRELLECFNHIQNDKHCRAVVLSGSGKGFSSGLDYRDLKEMVNLISEKNEDCADGAGQKPITRNIDSARKAKFIRSMLLFFQDSFSALQKCDKPVISAIHGWCIGAAMSLITAADIRYCTQDAFFQIKDVEAGFAPDMGTLQRMPKIVGNDSTLRELVYTSRKVAANEAKEIGLVSKIFADTETAKQAAIELARNIAVKSPIAVQSAKISLKYSRDHSVADGLNFMANWNMVMLQSEDVLKSTNVIVDKSDKSPTFSNL